MKSGSNSATGSRPWAAISIATLTTALGWPIAARFYSPTAIDYVQFPGIVLFALVSTICTACFLYCPRRPLVAKLLVLALATNGFYWALDAVGYYCLHTAGNP